MRKIHVVALALVSLFAFGAMATSASAEFLLALWLDEGRSVEELLLVEIPGELLLVNLNGGGLGVPVHITCSGILVGWVGPESLDGISEVLNLAKELISSTALSGLSLENCVNNENCPEPLVWAENLPWESEAELLEQGAETFFVDLLFNAAYYVECHPVFTFDELCTAPVTAVELKNETNGTVTGTFSDPFQVLAGLVLGECTPSGGKEVAEVSGSGSIVADEGTLEVSSE